MLMKDYGSSARQYSTLFEIGYVLANGEALFQIAAGANLLSKALMTVARNREMQISLYAEYNTFLPG